MMLQLHNSSLQLITILILIGVADLVASASFDAMIIIFDSETLIKKLQQQELTQPMNCGTIQKGKIQRRIVGGAEASYGAWPWQIAVHDRRKGFICGGTLITDQFVLTAAHCVTNSMNVTAGEYTLYYDEGTEQHRKVVNKYKHPDYNEHNVDNDIALLKLDRPLNLTSRIWPACLPEQDEELKSNSNTTILGWGATSYSLKNGKPQVVRDEDGTLYQATVPVVDFEECKNSYGHNLNANHVICAGYKEGGTDSCAGDSGGPLLLEKDNRWFVYGVTSYGDECGKEGKYGVYTKTSTYVDWIRKTIQKNSPNRTNI